MTIRVTIGDRVTFRSISGALQFGVVRDVRPDGVLIFSEAYGYCVWRAYHEFSVEVKR